MIIKKKILNVKGNLTGCVPNSGKCIYYLELKFVKWRILIAQILRLPIHVLSTVIGVIIIQLSSQCEQKLINVVKIIQNTNRVK